MSVGYLTHGAGRKSDFGWGARLMPTVPPSRNLFLSGLTAEDFSLLRAHLAPRELRTGSVLYRCGDRMDEVIFPHSGVAVMTAPPDDAMGGGPGVAPRVAPGVGIALIGRDCFAGGFAAAASAPASCDCEILIAGKASKMSASAFRYALDRSQSLRRWAAQYDEALMAQAQQTAICNAAHSVEARICRWLLEVQDRCDGERIPLTHGTLAQLLSVRRTTVTLVAGRLEAAGAINCRRGLMQIVDRAALERLCCKCHGHLKRHAMRPVALQEDHALPVGSRALDSSAT
jgi:CRP-like cAMP-binding protein